MTFSSAMPSIKSCAQTAFCAASTGSSFGVNGRYERSSMTSSGTSTCLSRSCSMTDGLGRWLSWQRPSLRRAHGRGGGVYDDVRTDCASSGIGEVSAADLAWAWQPEPAAAASPTIPPHRPRRDPVQKLGEQLPIYAVFQVGDCLVHAQAGQANAA